MCTKAQCVLNRAPVSKKQAQRQRMSDGSAVAFLESAGFLSPVQIFACLFFFF